MAEPHSIGITTPLYVHGSHERFIGTSHTVHISLYKSFPQKALHLSDWRINYLYKKGYGLKHHWNIYCHQAGPKTVHFTYTLAMLQKQPGQFKAWKPDNAPTISRTYLQASNNISIQHLLTNISDCHILTKNRMLQKAMHTRTEVHCILICT